MKTQKRILLIFLLVITIVDIGSLIKVLRSWIALKSTVGNNFPLSQWYIVPQIVSVIILIAGCITLFIKVNRGIRLAVALSFITLITWSIIPIVNVIAMGYYKGWPSLTFIGHMLVYVGVVYVSIREVQAQKDGRIATTDILDTDLK